MIARFRCGNEERSNRYWLKEEEKECRICRRGKETIEHYLEECIMETRVWQKAKDLMDESGEGESWMKCILNARKRKNQE